MLLVVLAVLLASAEAVAAEGSMLVIDRADARIEGGRWRNIMNGWFDEDLYPSDKVEIELRIENLYERDDGLRIRDIEAELYIDRLGSGSRGAIEDTARVTSISQGRRSTVTLRFEVPFDAYEGFHEAEIIVTGRDTNGTTHRDELFFDIDVFRNYNELYLRTMRLSRTRVSCTNTRTSLEVDMYNTGMNDQDDLRVRVLNDELGIDRDESNIVLESIEYDTRRSRYQRTFTLNIPEDADPGIYYLDFIVYMDGSEFKTEQLELEVLECPRVEPEEPEEDEGIIIIDPEPTPPPVDRPPREEPAEENDTLYLVLLVTLNVLMVIGIIALIVVSTGAKRRGRSRFY